MQCGQDPGEMSSRHFSSLVLCRESSRRRREKLKAHRQSIPHEEGEGTRSGGPSGNRNVSQVQPGAEQIVLKVPSEKVAMIIGKGGETIKSMQSKTGARIQVSGNHYRAELKKASLARLSVVCRSLQVSKSGVKKKTRQATRILGRKGDCRNKIVCAKVYQQR